MSTTFCSQCGAERREGGAFCPACGQPYATGPAAAIVVPPRKQTSWTVGRILLALVLAIVAGILLSILAGLVVGGGEVGGSVVAPVLIGSVVILPILWVNNSRSARQVFRRSLLTLAVECFAMPIVGIVFSIIATGQLAARSDNSAATTVGGLLGGGLLTGGLTCVGFVLGIFCLVVYLALRAEPQPAR